MANLEEAAFIQLLEAQVTVTLGADRHEHSDEWQVLRNGYQTHTSTPVINYCAKLNLTHRQSDWIGTEINPPHFYPTYPAKQNQA